MSGTLTAEGTVSHFSGQRMNIDGRIIQRCTVCGEKLCDSKNVAMCQNADGTFPEFATFPVDRVIQVTPGNPTSFIVMPETDRLPEDACIALVE